LAGLQFGLPDISHWQNAEWLSVSALGFTPSGITKNAKKPLSLNLRAFSLAHFCDIDYLEPN